MSSIVQILLDKWNGNEVGLREDYKAKLEHGSWIVEFTKVSDGSTATMECSLDPRLLPPQKEGQLERTENEDLIHVYSLDRKGWRSFRVANVKSFYQKPETL